MSPCSRSRCWLAELAGTVIVAVVAWLMSAPKQPINKQKELSQ